MNGFNDIIIKEIKKISLFFLVLFIIMEIALFNSTILLVLRITASIFFLFVLPGFCIMFLWYNKFDFLERLIIGIVVSVALEGIISYYLNLLNIHSRFYGIISIIIILTSALVLIYLKYKKAN